MSQVDLLQHLEMAMRTAMPPLCGRDHVAYRSYYSPCKVRPLVQKDNRDDDYRWGKKLIIEMAI